MVLGTYVIEWDLFEPITDGRARQVMECSTSRELKDALDIQGGGLEQHWVFRSRVSRIRKPDHSCVTRAEREYLNQVGIGGRSC